MSEITLKKGKLSASLFKVLTDYYSAIPGIEQTYINARWEKWKHGRDIIIYLIRKDNKMVGWIIYNKTTSTIEEILVNSGRSQALLRFQAVDALIDKESLVSAEILEEDAEKFYWLEIIISDPPENQSLRSFTDQDGAEHSSLFSAPRNTSLQSLTEKKKESSLNR